MTNDTAIEVAASNVRFGVGVTAEIGMDLADRGLKRVLVVTDPVVSGLPVMKTVTESLDREGVDYTVYDQTGIEPTDSSLRAAIAAASGGQYDGFLGVGGGSAMDTAKTVNLYTTYPADFLDYVNAPVGKDLPVPGPLKPLICVPTTAGTGSETTGRIVFDNVAMHAKTGISSRRLRPVLGIIDPDNTRTMPAQVAACTALDVLTHAIESYTAIPFDSRPRPARPSLRPPYQGSNPISDVWSLQALRLASENLFDAVEDPDNSVARGNMLLAATYAGIGFGNAGCHLAHAMSYPVSGMVRDYVPTEYEVDHPLVPHGMSVVLNAPAAFRFTAEACPHRHLEAAAALGADTTGADPADAGKILADCLIAYMQRLRIPNGLSGVGYGPEDIPRMVRGVIPQPRLTRMSPRPVTEEQLHEVFADAMKYW